MQDKQRVNYREFKELNMPAIEQEVLLQWKEHQSFELSISQREGSDAFVFYEGPPSANGMPGIHHVISRTLKDLVCRFKTMKGFQVHRKAGWDTHGLPVELGVEKELGITKIDIGTKISVEDYNNKCRQAVMRYKDKWEEITSKMGYWVDMSDPYITFDNKYIESLWWLIRQLFDKGLLYKSISIQPYSPAAGTGLSSHELNQPGTYRDVKDTTVVAMFTLRPPLSLTGTPTNALQAKLIEIVHNAWQPSVAASAPSAAAKYAAAGDTVSFMAWTTTPWTLPANCGLTVGADIDYVLVQTFNHYTQMPANVILAKALLNKYFKPEDVESDFTIYKAGTKSLPWSVLYECKGADLAGLRYEQLMPYNGNTAAIAGGDPWRVVTGDFVTIEDGTGIVHTAPAFGADDYKVGKKHNLGILITVDREGRFSEYLGSLSGRYIKNYKSEGDYKDADVDIAVELKLSGHAFKIEKYEHSYPHCWRTDKPVIYYPLDAWFVKTTAAKDRMIELNRTINWKPKATGEGRFGNWLENMVDWNLSRSRYWGTPLPIWVTDDGTEMKCIGSLDELMAETAKADKILEINQFINKETIDLHKPLVDQLVLVSDHGKPMHREPDLIDVWFDSGAMPYAQLHYPFDHKKELKKNFPADFIAEGVDQTRGWFYTLHALAVLLFDSVAYRTVVSNGLVLDKNGNKMSKRLGNAVDPFAVINKYSADATRWYLISNASPWDSLRFDEEGIKDIQRKYFGTLYNTYQFFVLYANLDGFAFHEKYIGIDKRPKIDGWILSLLYSLVNKVNEYLNDYEPTLAARALESFLDDQLSNWYVRLCRRRFWKGNYEHDKICAYQTLYECLETLALLMAPIAPFFADWLYQNLNHVTKRKPDHSVHLADYPFNDSSFINPELEEQMQIAQNVSSLVLSLRKKANIKVRQPLQRILIPIANAETGDKIKKIENVIKNEVNVKEIEYLANAGEFVKRRVKPNYRALGTRAGAKMKEVAQRIEQFTDQDINLLQTTGNYDLLIGGEAIRLSLTDVEIITDDLPGWTVASKDNLTVALDLTLTPALLDEGNARELINRVQKIRKDTGLEVTDRIVLDIQDFAPIQSALNKFNSYICEETLADNINLLSAVDHGTEIDVNDTILKIRVTKKN